MELETRLENDILYAVFKGSFTIEESKGTFVLLIDEVKKHRSSKILMDGRQLTGKPTTMERFFYGEFCAGEAARLASLHSLIPTFAIT